MSRREEVIEIVKNINGFIQKNINEGLHNGVGWGTKERKLFEARWEAVEKLVRKAEDIYCRTRFEKLMAEGKNKVLYQSRAGGVYVPGTMVKYLGNKKVQIKPKKGALVERRVEVILTKNYEHRSLEDWLSSARTSVSKEFYWIVYRAYHKNRIPKTWRKYILSPSSEKCMTEYEKEIEEMGFAPTNEIVTIDKKDIPNEILKNIETYLKTRKKERIEKAKAELYNAKHPNRKPKEIKLDNSTCRLFFEIKCAWRDHFFPKEGDKVFYYGEDDDKARKATVVSRQGDMVTLKISNGHIIKRDIGMLRYKNDFFYTDVYETLRNA